MVWVLAGWAVLSVLAAMLFSIARRRWKPVSVPREVREFLHSFQELMREHEPRIQVSGMVPGRFAAVITVRGQQTPVSLHHVFRRWMAFPDQFSATVGRFVTELERDALDEPGDHAFADAAAHILPQIRSREWLREHGGLFGDSALVSREFTPDLVICYVIDEQWCMTFVCQAHLRQWGRSEEDLFQLATRNLHRLAGADVPLPEPDGDPVLLRTGDGFDAARVLLLDPDRVEGLLVAMPERDVLWLGGSGGQDLPGLMSRNEEQSQRSSHPVSPHLYRMTNGNLVPVTDEVAQS
ncbi:MAG: DUF1444 family protein [Planctomycetota bacterium]